MAQVFPVGKLSQKVCVLFKTILKKNWKEFLRRKFNMQPFNLKTVYSILLAFAAYYFSFYSFNSMNGLTGMILRSLLFSFTMIAGIFYLRLTPDAMQLYDNVMKRWKK